MHNSDVSALTLDSPYLKKNGMLHFFPGAVREKNKTGNFVRIIYPGFSSFFFKETIDRGHPSLKSNLENNLRESHSDVVCDSDYAF